MLAAVAQAVGLYAPQLVQIRRPNWLKSAVLVDIGRVLTRGRFSGTFWAATISRALPHAASAGSDPDLFGVVAVTYRYSELARMLREAVSLRSSTKVFFT